MAPAAAPPGAAALEIKLLRADRIYRPGVSAAMPTRRRCPAIGLRKFVPADPPRARSAALAGAFGGSGVRAQHQGVPGHVRQRHARPSLNQEMVYVHRLRVTRGRQPWLPCSQRTVELERPGSIPRGTSEIGFSFRLEQQPGESGLPLLETYHGAYINIQYLLSVELPRGLLQKAIKATAEFIVEGRPGVQKPPSNSVNFALTADTQKHAIGSALRAGGFRISGTLATTCSLSEPLVGSLTVEQSALAIKSLEVQLLRIESVAAGGQMVKEVTEVQCTQIADGDVPRGLKLPIYIILPRLFTCPTISAGYSCKHQSMPFKNMSSSFVLEFESNVVVRFDEGRLRPSQSHDLHPDNDLIATETLPLRLVRA
eukprot:SM000135S27018  [mRNA]  locus=s135:191048:193749:- [translate_table: standard]